MDAVLLVFAVIGILAVTTVFILAVESLICWLEHKETEEKFADIERYHASISTNIKSKNS